MAYRLGAYECEHCTAQAAPPVPDQPATGSSMPQGPAPAGTEAERRSLMNQGYLGLTLGMLLLAGQLAWRYWQHAPDPVQAPQHAPEASRSLVGMVFIALVLLNIGSRLSFTIRDHSLRNLCLVLISVVCVAISLICLLSFMGHDIIPALGQASTIWLLMLAGSGLYTIGGIMLHLRQPEPVEQ